MPDDRGSLWIWFQASQWPKHRGKYFRLQAAVQRNSFLKCCGLTDASPIAPHKERSVGCRVMLTSNLKIDPMAHLLGMLVKISLDASQWLQAQTHFTNGVGGRRNVFRSTQKSLVLPWGDPALPGKWGLWGTPLLSMMEFPSSSQNISSGTLQVSFPSQWRPSHLTPSSH